MDKPREIVRATFANGSTYDVMSSPNVDLPASELKGIVAGIIKPTPVSVEVIETAYPELPLDQPEA